jgi:hypothetical protein
MSQSAAPDSGYVFEYLNDQNSLAIRRADMDDSRAREAFRTLVLALYRTSLKDADIDDVLGRCPAEWPFITVRFRKSDGTPRLKLGRFEREPGKNAGDNSVITHVEVARAH